MGQVLRMIHNVPRWQGIFCLLALIKIKTKQTKKTAMLYGVPQGSILRPLLFHLYILPLYQILQEYKVAYHSYADDTQIYLALSMNDFSPADLLCLCLEKLNDWRQENFLQLNKEKKGIILFGNKKGRLQLSAHLESKHIKTTTQAKNLGVIMDEDLCFGYIKSTTKLAFWHLRNIAKVRDFVSKEDMGKGIDAFISCRVDYRNALFIGLPQKTIRQLHLIQNSAARILTKTMKREHITPVLIRSLHWLPIRHRIDLKFLLIVYKSVNDLGPKYLTMISLSFFFFQIIFH